MRIVVALGGNAIAVGGEPLDARHQIERVSVAADALGELVDDGHQLIVTHGNGPQVGLLASQSPDLTLDVLGAESEGMLGYWIERELMNRLPNEEVATLLTQVEVNPNDPAFSDPTKPIGPVLLDSGNSAQLTQADGIRYIEQGEGYRRVVASPNPIAILAQRTIARLSASGVLVICGGGGGIPVARDASGMLRGCEAVIDKDRSAALLADHLDFDCLLLLTDVQGVFEDWPTTSDRPIAETTVSELQSLEFDRGSMGPKVEAACSFARRPKRIAAIGALECAAQIIRGEAGTRVRA